MSKANDPALYESGFERIEGDRYWTEAWLTNCLLHRLPLLDMNGRVWEPAAGRGDIVHVLLDQGLNVFASDVNMSEFDPAMCDCTTHDFLVDDFDPAIMDVQYVITNPPYIGNKAEAFVRRALSFKDIQIVAMLLRSEFDMASGRSDLFEKEPFAYEIKVTTRPRWDWWFREQPEASPRHNFSWFVWDRGWEGAPTSFWEGKPKGKRKKR